MSLWCGTILAATLSTGVEIPDEGVPMNAGSEQQYTVRSEDRPAKITDEATYLKWKWRMNLADPATGLDNEALRAGVKKIVEESGWKDGKEDWYDVAARCFDFLVKLTRDTPHGTRVLQSFPRAVLGAAFPAKRMPSYAARKRMLFLHVVSVASNSDLIRPE